MDTDRMTSSEKIISCKEKFELYFVTMQFSSIQVTFCLILII